MSRANSIKTAIETKISKSKFKANALEICRRVERTGEPVVIIDHGEPSLILQKHVAVDKSPLERLKNSVIRYDDPTVPVAENDWQAPEGLGSTPRALNRLVSADEKIRNYNHVRTEWGSWPVVAGKTYGWEMGVTASLQKHVRFYIGGVITGNDGELGGAIGVGPQLRTRWFFGSGNR